ncbi:Uncharacterized protein APZ42_002521, partial [Daphnia magna]
DNLPLTILKREGFRNLMAAAVPDYQIPSYERMRETLIPHIYEEVATTSMEGFLGVSCSAVTCDYEPFTAFLSLREMPKNHTAAAIFAEYESTIEDWEVNKKEIRCVTDNARNMIAALRVKLPTFVDETEKAQEEEELIGIEIEAGIDVPNYLLVPEFAELIAEADSNDLESNASDSEDHFVLDLDLE